MDFIRRIGTQKKKFKLQFFIGRLKFSSYFAGQIQIVIKRGDHKVKSQNKLQMSKDNKVDFKKQILQLQVTLFFDEKQNRYQQKLGQMRVILYDQKNNKILLGVIPFDIAQYVNSGQQSVKQKRKLQQTPKKLEGLIEYNVFCKYIGQGSESSVDKVTNFIFGTKKQENQKSKISQNKSKQEEPNKKTKKSQQQIEPKKNKNEAKEVNKKHQKQIWTKNKKGHSQQQNDDNPINSGNNKGSLQKKNPKTQYKEYPHSKDIKKLKQQQKIKTNKNYVTAGKTKNQDAFLTQDNDQQGNLSNKFYFDQPNTDGDLNTKKKNQQKRVSFNEFANKPSKGNQNVSKNQEKQSQKQFPKSKGKSKEQTYKLNTKSLNKKQQSENEQGSDGQQGSQGQQQQMQTSDVQPMTSTNVKSKVNDDKLNVEIKKNFIENPILLNTSKQPMKNVQKQINGKLSTTNSQDNKSTKDQFTTSKLPPVSASSTLSQQVDSLTQQNAYLKSIVSQSEKSIKQLNKKLTSLKEKNQELASQLGYYQSQLKQKQQELSKQRDTISHIQFSSSSQKGNMEFYQQEIKRLQKQKNQVVVELSKQKDKYKQDFKKYQQILNQKKQKQTQLNETSRAQIKRLKQQFSSQNQKIQKLNKQKQQRSQELSKQKDNNKKLQLQVTNLKDNLSKVKLKIGSLLNDALQKNQESTIEMLMDLNKE